VSRARWIAVAAGILLAAGGPLCGVERFPPPEFTGGHVLPETTVPGPEPRTAGWVDVTVLLAGLVLAAWVSLKLRSRAAMVVLSLGALAYFGFWRRGCVCAIGAVQNVARGVADAEYAVPLAVAAFFVLPLVFALIWGRAFCAGVCPHGAIQDLVLVKPVKVPRWLDAGLRVVPWVYLGLAVLLAATGGLFIICKYDPFVGIFRMSGSRAMLLTGAGLLVLGMFVGRPYCRYLCPLGVLLGVSSRAAKWRPTVTPGACTQCRLCESACPFGALDYGSSEVPEQERLATERKRVLVMLLAAPVAVLGFGWLGGKAGLATTAWHPDGKLAALVAAGEKGELKGGIPDEVTAYRRQGARRDEVYARAAAVENRALPIGRVIGGLLGLVLAAKAGQAFFPKRSRDYQTDPEHCVSCTRCFSACPYELARRGIPIETPEEGKTMGEANEK